MADVFKLLTRSTTISRRRDPQSTKPAVQPAASPGSGVSNTASKPAKKKRKDAGANGANGTISRVPLPVLPKELDFFGLNEGRQDETGKKRKWNSDGSSADDVEESNSASEADGLVDERPSDSTAEAETEVGVLLPTEAETRSTLRQHKLKFTILSPVPTVEPALKKKKKLKVEKLPKKYKEEIIVPPLMAFSHLRSEKHGYALSPRVYANILAQGYDAPTEVQMGTLPVLMRRNLNLAANGKPVDLLTCAPTGSGKTLAYVVPLLDGLLKERKEQGKKKGVKAVILAPTKELVGQIENEIKKLALGTGVRVSQLKKGQLPVSVVDEAQGGLSDGPGDEEENEPGDSEPELSGSADGPEDEFKGKTKKKKPFSAIKADIIVCTPLTLLHAVESSPSPCMRGLSHLIFDEADVLLDPLFLPQTQPLWTHVRAHSSTLRTTLWSATIASSTEVLVKSTLGDRTVVRLIVGIKDTSLPTISQSLTYCATESGKLHALRSFFATALKPPILIFVQSIERAQALLAEILYDLPTPGRIAVLHSAMTDTAREATMARFHHGDVWVLITTDVMSRGIDFRGVLQVLNYDIPTSVAAYIHRVGRTGRGGSDGQALTYYTKADVLYVRGFAHVIDASRKEGEQGVAEWLMKALPKAGKRDRQRLKKEGVRERRGKGKEARITTRPGWERRAENNRQGAVEHSRRRKQAEEKARETVGAGVDDSGGDSEWRGFD